jgi:hypothetical protein
MTVRILPTGACRGASPLQEVVRAMRRALCLALVFASLALPSVLRADEPLEPGPWNYGAVVGLNLNQSAFSDNWSGGDNGAINWVLGADLEAKRQFSRTFNLSNELHLAFGQTQKQEADPSDPGDKDWTHPDKTTDLIQFESVGRWTLSLWLDPYLALRLDSQFVDQSSSLGDLLFNPVKVAETAGVAHAFIEEEERQVVARAGFGFRQSFAKEFTDDLGDETERFVTHDGGFEFQTDAKLPLANDRVLYEGKLQLFWPVFYDKSGDLEDFDALALAANPAREEVQDFWKDPDINFQNTFTSEITSWLNVNLYVQWVYDKYDAATDVMLEGADTDSAILDKAIGVVDGSVRKSGQFKQTLGVGLTYRFI